MTNPTNPAEIITRLRAVAKEMQTLGAAMSYFGGFDAVMAQRGGQLFEDGVVIQGWVNEMAVESGA